MALRLIAIWEAPDLKQLRRATLPVVAAHVEGIAFKVYVEQSPCHPPGGASNRGVPVTHVEQQMYCRIFDTTVVSLIEPKKGPV